jgi:hypothetical protein
MEENKKFNHQMEINDLIDDAITNAVTRRSLVETKDALFAVSDEEAAIIAGGTGVQEAARIAVPEKTNIAVAGFKPVNPRPPVKPICPPIIVGLIALPDDKKLA